MLVVMLSETCSGMKCRPNQVCKVVKGKAKCQCPVISDCSHLPALVCGSDGTEYPNECFLKVKSCRASSRGDKGLKLLNKGKCGEMNTQCFLLSKRPTSKREAFRPFGFVMEIRIAYRSDLIG